MSTKKLDRPVNINLLKIRLPLSAFASITHRLSGILTFFLVLPVIGYLLSIMLESELSYTRLIDSFNDSYLLRTFVLSLVLIFQYHVFTGVRHILQDFHIIGDSLASSHKSAVITIIIFLVNATISIWLVI